MSFWFLIRNFQVIERLDNLIDDLKLYPVKSPLFTSTSQNRLKTLASVYIHLESTNRKWETNVVLLSM